MFFYVINKATIFWKTKSASVVISQVAINFPIVIFCPRTIILRRWKLVELLLDFTSLGADLAARGYVDGARWQAPDPEQLRRALLDLEDVFDTTAALSTLKAQTR